MPELHPFISTYDLNALMRTELDEDDLLVAIALDSACTAVRRYTRQTVNYVAADVVAIDGNGMDTLRLPQIPVRLVETVELDGEELALDAYVVDHAAGLLQTTVGVWPKGRRNVVVTYDHGWDIEPDIDSADPEPLPVPADMRLVALLAARRVMTAAGQQEGRIRQETIGSYSYTVDAAESAAQLIDSEKAVLDRYRVIR